MMNQEKELSEEAKNKKREYAKKWRNANKDKVKESMRKYWEKKAKVEE